PALDRVAAALGLPCFETPTGWKFFGTLLDAGKIRLCGEESAGASGDHVREKDGLWAALFWLDILAARGMTVDALRTDHWRRFGRDFTARHDYEGLDNATADRLIADLRASLPTLPGRRFGVLTVGAADEFAYTDPVDGAVSARQGIRVFFREGARAVYRLSGTGTSGATMRVYLDRHEADPARQDRPAAEALAEVAFAAGAVARLAETTGRKAPTNVQ
ncbi:MAG: alpha-D-glucose phosphate-specific phosphoglucomutase, partial [Alphaproteobacteria bacterium]|nr:alpha-D-glucose phosphate-specific phosphoglucomutase [Alphaproteobacteria bacterium]